MFVSSHSHHDLISCRSFVGLFVSPSCLLSFVRSFVAFIITTIIIINNNKAFMFSLGCIQALKCNTNKCPTGITTLDEDLMSGLDPTDKTHRVFNFHNKTVAAAASIAGVMGHDHISFVEPSEIMRRVTSEKVMMLSELFPPVEPGSLLKGNGPERLQTIWDTDLVRKV